MVTIEPSPRVILQATQVIPHGFSPESSPSSRQPLNLQNRFKARIFPRTLGVDGHVKAAECFLPVWGGATEETLEWHGVAPIKWLKIDGATGVITLWFLSGRESTLKGIEIWTRNTKTWEAPFFLPKEEQTFEAYFPLGKANMSPENQWLEDVFPIEIRSPFLGDVLVFGGVSPSFVWFWGGVVPAFSFCGDCRVFGMSRWFSYSNGSWNKPPSDIIRLIRGVFHAYT